MLKTGLFIVFAFALGNAKAQECDYTGLSKTFNYQITLVKNSEKDTSSQIYVQVFKKTNKNSVQKLIIEADYLSREAFRDCSNFISYITGKNRQLIADCSILEGDYGDFIVADFNFDGKEDFAIKRDYGGNGGPLYSYFIQNRFSVFQEDHFLTHTMGYFPCIIDVKNKRLTTFVHANAYGYNENIYKYNTATKRWTLLKRIYRKA